MTESVLLTVTLDGKKLVIGTLSQDKFPQISFDLVFEREFELSHNCTKGSVHFIGYKSPNIDDQYPLLFTYLSVFFGLFLYIQKAYQLFFP